MQTYKRVLTIAGSDSGGGAGIQADIKAISACGCYAASAITAVTVQNTLGVHNVMPVPTDIVRQQIEAVLDDIGADAIKIGMLHNEEVVCAVADELCRYTKERTQRGEGLCHYVVDPVMVSTSGHRLIEEKAVQALKEELIPLAHLITPNLPEAEVLLQGTWQWDKVKDSKMALKEAAQALSEQYGVSVLLKAGHVEEEQLTDILFDHETCRAVELPARRVETRNTHGTGCTLSSAIAAYLARDMKMTDAVKSAKAYINQAIIAGAAYEIGHGYGPVAHFYAYTK
ncbi:MAG: bifunctional hydroxymethylpyrimidine kinase/phosphomethylpyrimidine kinase [Paludibacteraceae bacterium]|nr:bifunctional hydroxymethylpyrimidine kinase/phosphomethylpyrimidine kinase [Paludibacteraceae bacterium]